MKEKAKQSHHTSLLILSRNSYYHKKTERDNEKINKESKASHKN